MNNKIEQYVKTLVKLEKLKLFRDFIPFSLVSILAIIFLSAVIATADNPMLVAVICMVGLVLVFLVIYIFLQDVIRQEEEQKKKLDPTNRIKSWLKQTKEKISL